MAGIFSIRNVFHIVGVATAAGIAWIRKLNRSERHQGIGSEHARGVRPPTLHERVPYEIGQCTIFFAVGVPVAYVGRPPSIVWVYFHPKRCTTVHQPPCFRALASRKLGGVPSPFAALPRLDGCGAGFQPAAGLPPGQLKKWTPSKFSPRSEKMKEGFGERPSVTICPSRLPEALGVGAPNSAHT
jgi:hypothetical protein